MLNELIRNRPRRWKPYAVLVAFPVMCLLVVAWGFAEDSLGGPGEEGEGVYWSASQYQIQFGKLREALLQVLAAPADRATPVAPQEMRELQQRADNLSSRTKRLIDASSLHERLRAVPGFDERAEAIAAFDAYVQKSMKQDRFTRADALDSLEGFAAMDLTVNALANAARQREADVRTELLDRLQRLRWYTLAVAAVVLTLLGWIVVEHRSDERGAARLADAFEAEEKAKAALKQSINTKAQFLSMVSHELRSPLQVIVSSVDLLELGTPEFTRRTAVARIRRAALMLGVQLRDLLTIARGESGRYEGNPESFEATAFFADVAEVAAHAAREKGLTFNVQMPPPPVFVLADVQRISQVLANLVSNAVKYTDAGTVSVTLLPPELEAGLMSFIVEDTGPGLPQRGIERLQTPLSRDEELRPREDGSGVGLTVVRTVSDHLNATLEIEAREGEGTRFKVTIPVIYEDPEGLTTETTSDGLVLLVDDRADVAASITALVERAGHPCHVARSSAEAAILLSQNKYETAFFDLDLAGPGGVDLAERVRREVGLNQQTYIVAITASRPTIRIGLFDAVLIKPVEYLRVLWHLAHRSRVRTREMSIGQASRPSEL